MVNELLELWKGCWIGDKSRQIYVRGALLGVICDVPASRKVGGYVGHSALHGCT